MRQLLSSAFNRSRKSVHGSQKVRLEALESRRLLTALVLDVTDPDAYGVHQGQNPPAPATVAPGNDDWPALN